MNRLVTFMASSRLLWNLWLSLGTPLFFLGFALDVLVTLARDFRANWHYEWKDDAAAWFSRFREAHRKALL